MLLSFILNKGKDKPLIESDVNEKDTRDKYLNILLEVCWHFFCISKLLNQTIKCWKVPWEFNRFFFFFPLDDHFISTKKKEDFYFEGFRQYSARENYILTYQDTAQKQDEFFSFSFCEVSHHIQDFYKKHGSNFTTPTV